MADWVKMGIKAALVAVITAALIFILTAIAFPTPDMTAFVEGVSWAYAIGNYYIPLFTPITILFVALLGLEVTLRGVYLGIIAWRWIFKVNE